MEEVLFYRGIKNKYNKALYGNGIYFATDTKEIIVNGVSYGSVDIDDELTEIGNNPVKGSAIYKAIKDNITNAVNSAPYGATLELSASNNTYTIILRDKNGNKLSEVGPIVGEQSDAVDISGLRVSRVGKQHLQVKNGQTATLGFTYDIWDSAGQSLGTSGKAYLYADENYETLLEEKTISIGEHNFDVTSYLSEGMLQNFYVRVVANTNKGEESYTLWYTARLVNISITGNYAINTVTKKGNKINFPGTITGINGLKTVRAYLNGLEVNSVEVSGVTSNINLTVDTNSLSHGTHNVQIRADYDITDEYGTVISTVYSNIIYYDVIVVEEGNNNPVFACRFDYEDGDNLISGTPITTVKQYDLFNLSYYVYDNNSTREVAFYSENTLVGSNTFSDAAANVKYRYTTSGNKACYFEYNGKTYDFIIRVAKSEYLIDEPTSSLSLYLDALGKSNNSSARDSWNYGDITSTFENFNWSGNGWTGNSLKLFNNSKVTIYHQPFKAAPSGALAFTVRFKVSNVTNSDEVVISCLDEFGYGLIITTQEAKLITQTNSISTKFATDETYTIGFVSFPKADDNSSEYGVNNSNMCYIYVDGIISGGISKTAANEIYQVTPSDIVLQANGCELEVFAIRAYTTELTDDQMFNCHLIDLVSSEAISEEYEQNDILDLNGNITVEKVHGKIPYMIITGSSETPGLSQFEYAAVQNNKDDKYDVDSLLYVDDKDPSFNFHSIIDSSKSEKNHPQIRLQGTSSMGYPRKNYRIYLKQGLLYLGCNEKGEGGVLQKKSVYSMNNTSAPVNCFCFKADFAESSSSHNTGTTGLVEEILKKANDLTPPQEHVNSELYPYQVRTTVEGKPCLLFYRNNSNETPKFAGKFNFNNDKSTEDVFGFLGIPGYHDNAEYLEEMTECAQKSLIFPEGFTECSYDDDGELVVVTKEELLKDPIGSNPTECWEFLNNTTRMGNFLESDFDKIDPDSSKGEYYWNTSWESRFPDNDGLNAAFKAGVKPYYLMHTAKWLVSTNQAQATGNPLEKPISYNGVQYSYDSVEYRKAKFRAELGYYFDINYLCSYYIITDCLAAADQRVKNMMWGFWFDPSAMKHDIMGRMRCFPIFYDNDTILGLDNTGKIAINWDADENTKNGDSYAFAGHDSTIWINLRDICSDYLESAYKRLRNENMTNQVMLKWYNSNQSDMYSERIYNKDSMWKYIIPTNIGVPVLDKGAVSTTKYSVLAQMQGSRRAHRSWFVNNRMDNFDAKFKGGNYQSSEITWKGAIEVASNENIGLSATVSRNQYLGVVEATDYKAHQLIKPGEKFEFALSEGKGTAQGDVFHLYGIKWLKELDMSNWGGYEYIYFVGNMPTLEKLVIGGHRGAAPNVADVVLGNNTPSLKHLDITNIPISNIDLSNCIYLETLIASGSKLASVALAEGCNIKNLYLPNTFTNLSLVALPYVTVGGIHLENSDNLIQLRVEKCNNLQGTELLNSIISSNNSKLRFVRITDINMSGNGQDLIKYMNMNLGGLDSSGNTVAGKCKLIGKYRLTTLLEDSVYKQLCAYFDELVIEQPEYTIISFDLANSTPQKISNLDNNTGFKFSNKYEPSGHIKNILDKRHSYMVKSKGEGVFAAMQLSDSNSNYYADDTAALLNGTEGDYCMYEPHYWYKGINDYMNRTMYVLFSSNKECPKQAKGLSVALNKCTPHRGYKVNTAISTSEANALVPLGDKETCLAYSYILPKEHDFKQYRVASIANSGIGSIVVDKDGKILKKLSADSAKGMHNNSYLFSNLPENAYKIYITVDNNAIIDHAIYLTESTDLEAIEPEWVEHKACFVGRVMSTLYNGEVKSAIYSNANSYGSYYYSFDSHGMAVTSICRELANRGLGYYAADYEVLKDIIILAYAKYGGTDMQISYVGAGFTSEGKPTFIPSFKPGDDYLVYGIQDTKTTNSDNIYYDSYYDGELEKIYPNMATLMGYHQFIGQGSTVSNNDIVNLTNKTYSNNRTERSFKIYNTSTTKLNTFIIGGKYVDIFGTPAESGNSSTGFCSREVGSSQSGSSFVEFGYKGNTTTPITYNLSLTDGLNVTTSISYSNLARLQRVLIVPTQIDFYTDSNLYKGV